MMNKSFHLRHRVLLLVLAVLFAATAAQGAETKEVEDACVLARFASDAGIETLTVADVEAVRARFEPAPSVAAAGRLLVDAAVAHRLDGGSGLAGTTPQDWLAAYRKLVREAWTDGGPDDGARALRQRLEAGRKRFGVTFGPCYVPAKPAVAAVSVAD
ncbi:MAG: hypothetical protein AAGN66_14305 [Acidobacteriota bacterium]